MAVLGLITRQRLEKLARAGFGDGADVLDHFLPVHADAVVGQRYGAGVLVEADANLEFGIVFPQRVVRQRLKAQLVGRIRGVGNQLAQENFLVAVERMNHQLQQLFDFGLKAQGFLVCCDGHGVSAPVFGVKSWVLSWDG